MLIPFRKMQAQGNDFVILELLESPETRLPLAELAIDVCGRRRGVGADGLVALLADPGADARMLIHNSDGSRAAMCGSALRCCAWLLHDLSGKTELRLATDSGFRSAAIEGSGTEKLVCVNLGQPVLLESELAVEGVSGSLVDVGNLHFVTFWDDPEGRELALGPVFERSARFEGGVNSEFVRVQDRGHILMRVWERGCGATQACGSGAVASVFAGIHQGLLEREVEVAMPGGQVRIQAGENYLLRGAVADVFTGVYRWRI